MEILIKVIQFFMSLTLLVAVHEFGHFIVARMFKIRVEKFYIFFDWGFSLWKKKWGDTEYGLGWLPLGGYCKIAGMIDESMDKEQMARPPQPWEYRAKPAWQRFFVLIAGVTMNLVLAFMIYCGIAYTWGKSYIPNENVIYGSAFNEDGEKLGFRDGDRVVSINGQKIENYGEIMNKIILADKGSRKVEVVRDGEVVSFDMNYDVLNDMRGEKRFEGLCQPLVPFTIDSVSSTTAREAGLLRGDRIVALNDKQMLHYGDYAEELTKHAGETVTLTVQRDTTTLQLAVPPRISGP